MPKKKKFTPKKPSYRTVTKEEYLTYLIKMSEDAIDDQGGTINELFEQQAKRIRKELENLRKNK